MRNSRTPDGRSYLKVPASSGGYTKRSMPALPPAMSTLQQLEAVVVSEPTWRVIKHVKTAAPTQGVRCRYTPIDIVVMGVAAQQYGSVIEADRNLRDPDVWERLRRAAVAAFPNDSAQRLSQHAPSRHQFARGRHMYASGEVPAMFKRALDAETMHAATRKGMFDPTVGNGGAPDKSRCVVADSSRVPVSARHVAPGKKSTGSAYGRELVMLACGSPGNEHIVLDAEFMAPRGNDSTRYGRNGADHAVTMLERLLAENDSLRPGLRGFVHDMAMTSEAIDNVLALGVLPITKTPRGANGACRQVNLGIHNFTASDGTQHDHEVTAIGGEPTVAFSDSRGAVLAVALDRQHIRWRSSGQGHVASGRYAMPHAPPVPTQLRGASTIIRLNSTHGEITSIPHKRRTSALRATPESDTALEASHVTP